MLISTDAIVEAVGNSVRRALDSGGEVELKTEAPTPLMWPMVPFGARGLPSVTTLTITDWTTPEVPYDELLESWLDRNNRRLEGPNGGKFPNGADTGPPDLPYEELREIHLERNRRLEEKRL